MSVPKEMPFARLFFSKSSSFTPGQLVSCFTPWRQYPIVNEKRLVLQEIPREEAHNAINLLGSPGLTAYIGLLDYGSPVEGETLLVSSASSAVGLFVGQIGKIKGLRVVGITSSEEKCNFCLSCGFDAVINSETTTDLAADIKANTPKGIDVYFDNVGGEISDTIIPLLNDFARVALCGSISEYNLEGPRPKGIRIYPTLLSKRIRMQGFIVSDSSKKYGESRKQLIEWKNQGKMKSKEDIVEGLENAPKTLIELFKRSAFGKKMIKAN